MRVPAADRSDRDAAAASGRFLRLRPAGRGAAPAASSRPAPAGSRRAQEVVPVAAHAHRDFRGGGSGRLGRPLDPLGRGRNDRRRHGEQRQDPREPDRHPRQQRDRRFGWLRGRPGARQRIRHSWRCGWCSRARERQRIRHSRRRGWRSK